MNTKIEQPEGDKILERIQLRMCENYYTPTHHSAEEILAWHLAFDAVAHCRFLVLNEVGIGT